MTLFRQALSLGTRRSSSGYQMVRGGAKERPYQPIEAFIVKGDERRHPGGSPALSRVFALMKALRINSGARMPLCPETLCELMESGRVQPDLVIGVPVALSMPWRQREAPGDLRPLDIHCRTRRPPSPCSHKRDINTYAEKTLSVAVQSAALAYPLWIEPVPIPWPGEDLSADGPSSQAANYKAGLPREPPPPPQRKGSRSLVRRRKPGGDDAAEYRLVPLRQRTALQCRKEGDHIRCHRRLGISAGSASGETSSCWEGIGRLGAGACAT